MKICCEYLHTPYCEYKKLPFREKMKLILYEELERKRQNYFQNKTRQDQAKQKEKMEAQKLQQQNKINVRSK